MEPLLSLAFSRHGNKGVYAVLLGSGISRAARNPWSNPQAPLTTRGNPPCQVMELSA
jgi:hypothetical protein